MFLLLLLQENCHHFSTQLLSLYNGKYFIIQMTLVVHLGLINRLKRNLTPRPT